MPVIRGSGLPLALGKNPTNTVTLAAGQSKVLPAGPLMVHLGQYSFLQYFDPVINPASGSNAATTGFWKEVPAPRNAFIFVESDGANYRLANTTGCAVGALITNAGSGYTSAPTVTPSAGGAQFQAIVGGLVSTVQSVPANAGSGYTIPPQIVVSQPANTGYAVQARAHCTISAGVVNAIVVDNQGAGYVTAPTMTFITDPNDTGTAIVPAGATVNNIANSALMTLTGAGTISAVVCINPGLPQTAVPTLAFAGGGGTAAAATALMNFSVTGYTVTGGGTGIPAGTALVSTGGNINTATVVPVHTQPDVEQGILIPRQTKVVPALSGGVIVASGTTAPLNVEDWGLGFSATSTLSLAVLSGSGAVTTGATIVPTVGGQTDVVYIQPLTS
jgi:hypothetical protein